ncbi:STAS domain-containing protein, partial [Methanobrevibacter sp. OttesenSCG-928-K11]|nr:STAS domain-containing protein [Methanobrevibacter sp. OttesenSCG-928-K11]
DNLNMVITDRLDTNTAPELEKEILDNIEGVKILTLDFENLMYISSAGLRVILSAQKIMNNQGEMIIKNVNDIVMEVFTATGFVDILNIQ